MIAHVISPYRAMSQWRWDPNTSHEFTSSDSYLCTVFMRTLRVLPLSLYSDEL